MTPRICTVSDGLHPRQFTISNLRSRLENVGEDPLLPVLRDSPDLLNALERLAERFV